MHSAAPSFPTHTGLEIGSQEIRSATAFVLSEVFFFFLMYTIRGLDAMISEVLF